MNKQVRSLACVLVLAGACSTLDPDRLTGLRDGYAWNLPAGLPQPVVPVDNPMSQVKVELGRALFYDARLSGNQTYSCATCHRPELAFTDGRARALGSTGELHPRSTMSLVNVAYNLSYNWADPNLETLEEQALIPMFNQAPVELGLVGMEQEVVERLKQVADYRAMFAEAFPERPPITSENVRKALASFVRTIISGDSAYDHYLFWDQTEALTTAQHRGMELFFSPRTRCSECHKAPLFTSGLRRSGQVVGTNGAGQRFHNTGLYNLDGDGAFPEGGQGLVEHTGLASDMGRFRTPTLRNIELTAPYMHDGSLETLIEVVDFYAAGGRGEGKNNPFKSGLVEGFVLTEEEKNDLIEFLCALSDQSLLENPQLGPGSEPD